MKIKHFVKVFFDNGITEGIFSPGRSNEYNLAIETGDFIISIPWQMVQSATFLPQEVREETRTEPMEQLLMFG